ncbi:MAG: hypothetical protein FDZ70_10235, partial [Actinobacteria bacterium]
TSAGAAVSWSDTTITVTVPSCAAGNVTVDRGGLVSNGVAFTPTAPPSISSLSTSYAAVGTPVTITGDYFGATQGANTVTFNGTPASVASWSNTSITAIAPGDGPVVVSVGGISSNAATFTSYVVPVISAVTPSPARTGTAVTVSGTGFGATQGGSTVTFNGAAASVTSWSDTAITCTVPGNGPVVVTVAGHASNAVAFTAVPAPAITLVSPNPAEVGAAVTISGTDFGAVQGLSTVTFNGVPATVVVWADTAVTVDAPGDGPVVVTCDGIASNAAAFSSYVSPVVSGVSPSPARVGTSVTVSGTGFGPTQGASTVAFNGATASVVSWSDTAIACTVPGNGPVVVTVGGHASNAVAFTAVPAPAVTLVAPNPAAVGTEVTVSGTSFGAAQGASTVAFNGIAASVTSWSDTTITAIAPGNGPVVVTCDGIASNAAAFTALNAPVVSGVTPSPARIGTAVTVTGSAFGAAQGASSVSFNGVTASVTGWSDSAITCLVPGNGPVVVTVGGIASNAVAFTAVPAPVVSAVAPNPAELGTAVTISGTSFGAAQGASTV